MTQNKPLSSYTTPQSVSLELRHVAMISDLVNATGLNRSQIVRAALEEYYANHHPETPKETTNEP